MNHPENPIVAHPEHGPSLGGRIAYGAVLVGIAALSFVGYKGLHNKADDLREESPYEVVNQGTMTGNEAADRLELLGDGIAIAGTAVVSKVTFDGLRKRRR